ncbi:MAG: hypothetical protein IKX20_03135 [Paludibacteraceae bacterium]|nr:hypothetical protein [Paludibacteraceae bacterium]
MNEIIQINEKEKEEIKEYITHNELAGAVLLTGKWGCGKTYLIKQIAQKYYDDKSNVRIAVISLFGLESVNEIRERVKEEFLYLSSNDVGKQLKNIDNKAKEIIGKRSEAIEAVADMTPVVGPVIKGVATFLSIDYMKWFYKVGNTLKNGERFVIAFDDFERNKIEMSALMGAINDYLENDRIKVIILADEDKIVHREEYDEYKEKLISKTIRMETDIVQVIYALINGYVETAEGYRQFLSHHADILIQVFDESNSNNIRIMKMILASFERVFEAWKNTRVPEEKMGWVLYTFAAKTFITKNKRKEENHENNGQSSSHVETHLRFRDYKKNFSYFFSLEGLIGESVWDRERFKRDLEERYIAKSEKPVDRFLTLNLWSTEQKDIDEGFPEAIKLAYEGELSRKQLIILLQKVHALLDAEIALPCEIDYKRIEQGLNMRMNKIKKGIIVEPECSIFTTDEEIDKEAIPINKKIKELRSKIEAWERRSFFIKYLNEEEVESAVLYGRVSLEEFDDELLEGVEDHYSKINNGGKEAFARVFLNIDFGDYIFSKAHNIQTTVDNITELVSWIRKMDVQDSVTKLINKEFIVKLLEKTNELKARFPESV